jgi:hypothetical protein
MEIQTILKEIEKGMLLLNEKVCKLSAQLEVVTQKINDIHEETMLTEEVEEDELQLELKDLYYLVSIGFDPRISQEQVVREKTPQKYEAELRKVMEIIKENQNKGYCIIDYGKDPSEISERLRDAGFRSYDKRFPSRDGRRTSNTGYSLVIFWREFDSDTTHKIIADLADRKKREYSVTLRRD